MRRLILPPLTALLLLTLVSAVALGAPRAAAQEEPEVAGPERLRIPYLGLDVGVDWVAEDEVGNMAGPANFADAAWYVRGPRPGARGNAVIAGHVTNFGEAVTPSGAPVAFNRLKELEPGDAVIVLGQDGVERRFRVTQKKIVAADDPDIRVEVFGSTDVANLNLISCDGPRSEGGEYPDRIIVFTTLEQ